MLAFVRLCTPAMLVMCAALAILQPTRGRAAQPAVDYAKDSAWVCRPGKAAACTGGLDAMVVTGDGTRTPQLFVPAADPPIDCFYVYPTTSRETTPYSDMTLSPEVGDTVLAQAGRLASRCRLFAPIYRQLTMAGLAHDFSTGDKPDWSPAYADVLAAWRWYMAHANAGRGVVLIGHSQGTILLHRLIAEQIDGKPDQARLVAAFLGGDPSLAVPQHALVGGAFRHIPLCASLAQTGCVYVWASYFADDDAADRNFGRNPPGDMVAACNSPAAPGGGVGALKAYLRRPAMAPEGDPPWVEVAGQLSGQCVADAQGNVLRVTVLPGRFADLLHAALSRHHAGWGLHSLDLALMQGNILDALQAEGGAWRK